jgi:hypothetical protein
MSSHPIRHGDAEEAEELAEDRHLARSSEVDGTRVDTKVRSSVLARYVAPKPRCGERE